MTRSTLWAALALALLAAPLAAQPTMPIGSGPLSVPNGVDDSSIQYTTPTTGTTVTMSRAAGKLLVINPAGTLAALTINLPTSPANGQVAHISTTQNITALTLSSPAGIIGNIGNLGASQTARYRYIGAGSFWLRMN